jgi:hypothetical protein
VGGDLDGGSPNIVSEWNASVLTTTALAQRVRNTFAQYYPMKPNLPLVAYEGGSHILNNSHLFRQNPLSYDMYKTWLNSTEGTFDLVMHYTHVGVWNNGGAWGAKSTTDQPLNEAHSYRALVDYIETGD